MKTTSIVLTVICFYLSKYNGVAQNKTDFKYGNIIPADFDVSKAQFDTAVGAVIIADVGRSDFDGNIKGWFSLSYKRQTRIKILNKTGFDAATVEIPLFFIDQAEEKLINLKASTYTLESGKVVETELDKKSIFKDKYDKNHLIVKFTLPGIKEGCIIEYSYTIKSDFLYNLQPWEFQGEYPVLWSQYEVKIPDFFYYLFITQGNFPIEHNSETTSQNYHLTIPGGASGSEYYTFADDAVLHKWMAKNVPALKMESFTSTMQNHISKIEFQLSQYRFPNRPVRNLMGNWANISAGLMLDESFGNLLDKNNNWLDDEIKSITSGSSDTLEKTKRIYAFVRDKFISKGNRGIWLSSSLKTIDKSKTGYVADLNLLLIAMLRHENINADPVILSTRRHGYTNELYPLLNNFNYVICMLTIGDKEYLLDASNPVLGFNHIPNECYNGQARIISSNYTEVKKLSPELIVEKNNTTVFMRSDKPGEWEGHMASNMGYYESVNARAQIKETGEVQFLKNIKADYDGEIELSETKVDQLKDLDNPLRLEYDFKIRDEGEMVYFNPMLAEGYKDNYFKSVERLYPVEMPYLIDETYILNFEVPASYTIEDLPKPAKVNFGEKDGFFEYMIEKSGQTIHLRSRVKLNRAIFFPEEYNSLREFYSYIIKKHAESIVLKKKK